MNLIKPRVFSYVRFSNPDQAKGDSLRRQTEAARAWAKENELELDDSVKMTDHGVSAFQGANKEAALGAFLKLVEQGAIQSGSVLVVESLDRISREEVMTALATFISLINAGITIVTLADHREYNRESIKANTWELVASIMVMQRAHEESLTKSKRISAAWKEKRNTAGEKKLTKQTPNWLTIDASGMLVVIPERVEVIKRIYQLYINGMGLGLIQRTLNDAKTPVPTWENARGWHHSYIRHLIKTRKVLGEFQGCKKVGKKRVPDGPVIPNYYPAVIDEATYYQAQNAGKIRTTKAGRAGRVVSNLFAHSIFCGYCGDRMQVNTKGPRGSYMICGQFKMRKQCVKGSFRLADLEKAFLSVVSEVNIAALSKADGKIATIDGQIAVASGKLAVCEIKLSNIIKTIEEGADPKLMAKRMGELQKEMDAQRKLVEELKNARASETSEDSAEEIKTMVSAMKGLPESELVEFRARLRNKIQNTVKRITAWSAGKRELSKGVENGLREQGFDDARIADYKQQVIDAERWHRWVEVEFSDGVVAFGWDGFGRMKDKLSMVVRTKTTELKREVTI